MSRKRTGCLYMMLMNINRTYISQAVNRSTRAGFSAFINELRIKEAVRLMSGDSLKNLTMEGIAREAGFNKLHILPRLQKIHRIFTDGLSWQRRFSVIAELYGTGSDAI